MLRSVFLLLCFASLPFAGFAAGGHDGHGDDEQPDVSGMIMHHVANSHEWHIVGSLTIPLPCIVYHPQKGFDMFMSSKFHHGTQSHNGYILDHGKLKYVDDAGFPQQSVHISSHDGEVDYNGKHYKASRASFYDFSITKAVANLFLAAIIMLLLFPAIARAYKKHLVPKGGLQSFFEPIILFVRDDIAKPNLGDKYEKYMPYLLTVFFFIWICNMLGLIPLLGSPNITGNIVVTGTLALFTFILTTLAGTKDYWGHIFNPPGVPTAIKFILVPIEILGIFIKPFALMIRLFANITAGHIIILSLVAIIFIFAHLGGTVAGLGTGLISGAFMLFMNMLELFVAALQAYIFTVLSAVFIGQALEEHHHEEAHH